MFDSSFSELTVPFAIHDGSPNSVGLTFSGLVLIAGLIMFVIKGTMGTPENVPGGMKMFDLCGLVLRGIRAFSGRIVLYFGMYIFLFFVLILIVFSPMDYYDGSDGIRYASSFLISAFTVLLLVYLTLSLVASSMPRAARMAMDQTNGLSLALRTCFMSAAAGAWVLLGGTLILYAFMYLIMSTNRNLPSQFKYYLSCDSNPAFCGQTIAAQTMVAFCCGVSCVTFLYRSAAGIFAKAAEIGSELVHKLEPENLTSDKLKNPATLADRVGALVLDAGGGVLEVAETMCMSMVAAQVMSEGDSARLAITFMYPACSLLATLLSVLAVRCSDAVNHTCKHANAHDPHTHTHVHIHMCTRRHPLQAPVRTRARTVRKCLCILAPG